MTGEVAVALVVPLVVAIFFRVPRRTLLLEKEVLILEKLPEDSTARETLERHIDELVQQEIEFNRDWRRNFDLAAFLFAMGYAGFLIYLGWSLGGAWWIAGGMDFALGALGVVAVLRILDRVTHRVVSRWIQHRWLRLWRREGA